MVKAINIIVIHGPDAKFIEIENDAGKSIDIGEHIPYGEYSKIRITPEDIQNA